MLVVVQCAAVDTLVFVSLFRPAKHACRHESRVNSSRRRNWRIHLRWWRAKPLPAEFWKLDQHRPSFLGTLQHASFTSYLRRGLASGEGIVTLGVTLSRCHDVFVSVRRAVTAFGKGHFQSPVPTFGMNCHWTLLLHCHSLCSDSVWRISCSGAHTRTYWFNICFFSLFVCDIWRCACFLWS